MGRMFAVKEKHIGVLMGGNSAERDISMRSGEAISESLKRRGYEVTSIDVTSHVAEDLRRENIELAFLALHGKGGEDGAIQGLLEVMEIPYTGSGIAASAVGMNKVLTKAVLSASGLPTPRGLVVTSEMLASIIRDKTSPPFSFPAVAKPIAQGSSFGVTVMRGVNDLQSAREISSEFGDHIMIEELITGPEFTVGILDEKPLPVLEILLSKTLFDFDTKYEINSESHAAPAKLSGSRIRDIQSLALQVHQKIGCRGVSRVDIRLDDSGNPFVLEINTIPGMTNESLLPLSALEIDIEYDDLVEAILCGNGGSNDLVS